MSKTFDFNSLNRPTLEVTFPDAAHTVIRVTTPTEAVFEKFITKSKEMGTLNKQKDSALLRECFQLYADIFSCNLEGMTFTAEDLRDVYGLRLEHLVMFNPSYLDFLAEIQNAKN